MGGDRDVSTPEGAERFQFEIEQHIIGREVKAIKVTRDRIMLALEGDTGISFSVSSRDLPEGILVGIDITLSSPHPTLDTNEVSAQIM